MKNMSKKQKWVFALYGIWLVAQTAYCIWAHDWCNLVWNWAACGFVLFIWRMQKVINDQQWTIALLRQDVKELRESAGYKRFLEANRRADIYFLNLERALKNMILLKEANKQLHILNKNLIENQYAGKYKGKMK